MSKSTYPLVTVLLCTYNDEQFIGEAIESILNQTYKYFDFLILNDGSTDDTKAIIESYEDPRIRYLENPINKGLEASKNRGIDEALGKYIAYIDGDDIALPKRLAKQVRYMESHPNVGLCATAIKRFGDKDLILRPPESDFEMRAHSLVTTPVSHPTCIIRTEVLRKHKIKYSLDYKAAEDYPFILSLLKVTEGYGIQTPLLRHRWHEQNTSVIKSELQKKNARRALREAYEVLLGIEDVSDSEIQLYADFFRKNYKLNSDALRRLHDRILIPKDLSERDTAFRNFIKKGLLKKAFEIENSPKPVLYLKKKLHALGVLSEIILGRMKWHISMIF